ncbi:MAG: HRDC domain-containing protein, partial [Bdellovibrionales bacterium]|nr:HRDC domain-containing protein [Bdellovibrionales bacterium]
MVFSDKTLRDLILKSPTTEAELENVYGFGKKKIDLFGKELLAQIK